VRDAFVRDGYTVMPELIGGSALSTLRDIYDQFLRGEVDCGEDFRMLGGVTRQVKAPRLHHEGLASHPVVAAAGAAAAELLDCEAPELFFDMMIYKPPGHAADTPWHQDLSYYAQPFERAGRIPPSATTQFWIALDDADVENGCMHFVPGVHHGPLLPHHVHSGDPADEGRLLAIVDPEAELDLSAAVACPVRAGGCTVHFEGTPHYTPPNRSADRPRRAYIMTWKDPVAFAAGAG
jgi:hypothetical protein